MLSLDNQSISLLLIKLRCMFRGLPTDNLSDKSKSRAMLGSKLEGMLMKIYACPLGSEKKAHVSFGSCLLKNSPSHG